MGAVLAIAARLRLDGVRIERGEGRGQFLSVVESTLYGVDVDPKACALAVAAVKRAMVHVSPGPLPDGFFRTNITEADFLAAPPAPQVYLEIKNVRRVADDIQKRLYEIAEASLEMKLLYGTIELRGLGMESTFEVTEECSTLRGRLREQIQRAKPVVVVLMLCSRMEAERYREGAEAFIDRLFFQEEIEECLEFLREAVSK